MEAGQFRIIVRTNSGTKVEETERLIAEIEREVDQSLGSDKRSVITNIGILLDWPAGYTPNAGPGDAFMLVQLKADAEHKAEHHIALLRERLKRNFPGTEFAFEPNSMLRAALNFGLPAPINVQVRGKDLHKAYKVAAHIRRQLRERVPGLVDVRIQQRLDAPQLYIKIDRRKAAELNLTPEEIIKNVQTSTTRRTRTAATAFAPACSPRCGSTSRSTRTS
jgi:multidrug efflux pump subunit AcrB